MVIAIDDASVEKLGRFPWPRSRYAELLDRLSAAQPAAIAFDILFSEPTDQDAQLAQSIVNSANVVLAVGVDSAGNRLNVTPSIATPATGFFLAGEFINNPDEDGISRALRLYGEDATPPLAIAALQVYAETLAGTSQATSAPVSHPAFGLALDRTFDQTYQQRVKDSRQVWVNWPGEVTASRPTGNAPGELRVYSFADVISGQINIGLLQNKIVLIGVSLTGVDVLRTPFQINPPASGVYFYAAAIDNLLKESYLQRTPQWLERLLLVFLALVSSRWLWRQSLQQRLALAIGFPLLWTSLALGCFWTGWWVPVAAPIGTVMFSALAIQLHEQREKQQLMALFSMHVSPEMATTTLASKR